MLAEAGLGDKVTQLLQAGSIAAGENGVVNDTRQPGYWSRARTPSMALNPEAASKIVYRIASESALLS